MPTLMTSDKDDTGVETSTSQATKPGSNGETNKPKSPPRLKDDTGPGTAVAAAGASDRATEQDLQEATVEESVGVGGNHGEASALDDHSKDPVVPMEDDVPGVAAVAAPGQKEDNNSDALSAEHSKKKTAALPVAKNHPGTEAVAPTAKVTGTVSTGVPTSSRNYPPGPPLSIKEMQCVNSWIIQFLKDHPHVSKFDSPDWPRCWEGMGEKVRQACGTNRTDAECRIDFEELREKRVARKTNRWTEDEEASLVSLRGILGNRWFMIGRVIGRYDTNDLSLLRKYSRILTNPKKRPQVEAQLLSPSLLVPTKRQKTAPASHHPLQSSHQSTTTPTRKPATSSTVLQSPGGQKIDVDRFVEKTMEKKELVSRNFEAHAAVVGGRMADLEYVWDHKDDEKNQAVGDVFYKIDSGGRNCLDLAAVLGRMEMVTWLLEKGLQFNTAFSYPFMMSLARGDSWEQFCTTTETTI